MCGIFGFKQASGQNTTPSGMPERRQAEILTAMGSTLIYRGPDENGTFFDKSVAMGIRRLKIIDLKTGSQPIFNEDNTAVVVLNGEIYNYQELRENLIQQGHHFTSASDTEVIVHLYEQYGTDCVSHLRGMFAFALWDKNKEQLFLARDRFGIKPLYYFRDSQIFVFASEIKALLAHPSVPRELNTSALHHYLTFLYNPTEETLFSGIKKLMPGHTLVVAKNEQKTKMYYDLAAGFQPLPQTDLESSLMDAVKSHLVSDVPMGCLLSGGLDSSLITALAVTCSNKKMKTFTVGFEKSGIYDERPYARRLANFLGTEHNETVVQMDAVQVLPQIAWYMDDPVADYSAIPHYYLFEEARKHVTVALSGLGGDEVFGGYWRYVAPKIWSWYQRLPEMARNTGEAFLTQISSSGTTYLSNFLRLMKKFVQGRSVSEESRYLFWNSFFTENMKHSLYTEQVLEKTKGLDSLSLGNPYFLAFFPQDTIRACQYVDFKMYLPGDTLAVTDRMSMSHSLEVRVPLLDHVLVENAWKEPSEKKVLGTKTKVLLKKIAQNYLPEQTLKRKKQGFTPPVDSWLRGELGDAVKHVLRTSVLRNANCFKEKPIQQLLDAHRSGKADFSQHLWALLVFTVWHRLFMESRSLTPFQGNLEELLA